jgi:methylmalonyl-CoA mutase
VYGRTFLLLREPEVPDDLATARKKTSAPPSPYRPRYPVRFVTAAALFDGHDASINIIRRMLQASGVEVIHLGHNRAVDDVLEAALQEDANGIAASSYQGGHVEYFKYLLDLLRQRGAPETRVFEGGGDILIAVVDGLKAFPRRSPAPSSRKRQSRSAPWRVCIEACAR